MAACHCPYKFLEIAYGLTWSKRGCHTVWSFVMTMSYITKRFRLLYRKHTPVAVVESHEPTLRDIPLEIV